MKVGDLVQMVTGLPGWKTNPRNNGLVVRIGIRHNNRRVATVVSPTGEIMTWPLDSNYEIRTVRDAS